MKIEEAYEKAKRSNMARPYLTSCRDFGDAYGFVFSTEPAEISNHSRSEGGGFVTVDKQSGAISFFNPASDIGRFRNSKKIPIETLRIAA